MQKILIIAIILFFSSVAQAQIRTSTSEIDVKSLKWNRYTKDNFVILSIDNSQGEWLNKNIETIKKWCLIRWGFTENSDKPKKECRVFCVPNKNLLKKMFGLEQSKVEIRRKSDQIDMTVMWLVLDDEPLGNIPSYLTQICLAEFEEKNNVVIGWWFKRGSSLLNGSVSDVRQQVASLSEVVKKDQPIFASDKMFTLTEDEYLKETGEYKKIFDKQAIVLCMMLRKEFGEAKLQGFLRLSNKNDFQNVLHVVYGFSGFNHFDKQYIRYTRDLTGGVIGGKTPDSYFEITPVVVK